MCNELRDLRAAVRDFLQGLGITPHLSEDEGFPRRPGDKPHIACLRTIEDAQLVIGVVQHEYGEAILDWGPYSNYSGLSPTHAEFLHALAIGKKFLLYVHESTNTAYYQWKSDPDGYSRLTSRGADVRTLKMLGDILSSEAPPWRETFRDSSNVLSSLKKNLVNEIYASLREQEQKNRGQAEYLTKQILGASPAIQREVQERLNPDILAEIEALKSERTALEDRLTQSERTSQTLDSLTAEKQSVEERLGTLQQQVAAQQVMLTMAAVKDAHWIQAVRTQMMPKQPGRTPFHNAAEVALRGYHASNSPRQPELSEVTWSLLPYTENGLHRGYRAGLIFRGSDFAPGITWAQRWKNGPESLRESVSWRLPSIYFGDYLEVSTHDDPEEGPVGYLNSEFAVKNPEGHTSDWTNFSYPFDFEKIRDEIRSNSDEGRRLWAIGDFANAVEPFRKAMVRSDRLLGYDDPASVCLRNEHTAALENAAIQRLRFRKGERVRVKSGVHAGTVGTIMDLYLHHPQAYLINTERDGQMQFADKDLEPAEE